MLWVICMKCNLKYSILCFLFQLQRLLVFEAFAVLGGLRFCGTFTLHLNWTEAVTSLSLQKINVEKNVVSDLGWEQKGRAKKGDLGHLPWKWVIIYTRHVVVSLSSIFIAVKSGYMLLPNPNLPFISFVLLLNGYKLWPDLPGTQGLAHQYWCLLPWWWGYQETITQKSRVKVLRGDSISRQAIMVCRVKISGS